MIFLTSQINQFFLVSLSFSLLIVAGAAPLRPATTTRPRHHITSPPSPKRATCTSNPPQPVSYQTLPENSRKHDQKWPQLQVYARPPPTFKTYLASKPSIPDTLWCLWISISTTVVGELKLGILGFENFRRRYLTI